MSLEDLGTYKTVKIARQGRHVIVILSRPHKSNSMNDNMWKELPQVFNSLDTMSDVQAVVLMGEGKNFCAGIDTASLKIFADFGKEGCPARGREQLLRRIKQYQNTITSMEQCRWPIIAAVHGACYGAGVDIITACDIRYCTSSARFCVKEVDVAIVADVGTLQRLPPIVGQGMASELALTARVINGQEAQQIGLVTKTFPDQASLLTQAHETAELIATKSPLAVVGTKRILIHSRDHSVAEGLDHVATYNAAMMPSSDMQEVFAVAMKRKDKHVFAKL